MLEKKAKDEKKWSKQDIVLFITKYISYALNLLIIAGVVGVAYFWISTLILSAK
jgi:hypothetical protein